LLGSCSRGHFQPERLALPETERERDDEPRSIAFPQRQDQNALDFLGLEGFDFDVLGTRWLGQRDRVPGYVAALACLAERGPGSAVDLVCSAGLESVRQHPGVQLLEMLGLDTVHAMCAEAGDQVPVHGRAVADVRLVAHRWLGDVLQPVSQPALDCPCPARFDDRAVVTLPMARTDGRAHQRTVVMAA
jgi:hypothetical protein